MDERGHWPLDQGDALEHALLSGLGKRGGRALIISTSAPDDAHPFSKWLDEEQAGVYRQEHRPAPGLPADDVGSLLQIGRAHVRTPVTNAHLVCRLLLEHKKT